MVSYARANTKITNKFMYQGITVPHEVGIIGLVIKKKMTDETGNQ